jgi:hypothetical protein
MLSSQRKLFPQENEEGEEEEKDGNDDDDDGDDYDDDDDNNNNITIIFNFLFIYVLNSSAIGQLQNLHEYETTIKQWNQHMGKTKKNN